jgi:hypothetical protein
MEGSTVDIKGLTDGGVKPTENIKEEMDDNLYGNWLPDDSVPDVLDETGADTDVDTPEDGPRLLL